MSEIASEHGVTVSSLPGVAVVTPPADINGLNAGGLLDALRSAASDRVTVVVDMSATEFCDSTGVAALVAAYKRARAESGDLRVVMGADAVRRIFKLTSVDRLLKIYDSLPAAVAGGPAAA